MKFENLLIKIYNNQKIKLINFRTGEEALIDDSKVFELLNSIKTKQNISLCTENEKALLSELENGIGIITKDGVYDLIINKGDFESLDIDITNSCNLLCKHCCFFGEGKHQIKYELDFGILIRVINEALELGLCKLKISGGEPFTYSKIAEILNFVADKNIHTKIVTNGLLLHKYIDNLQNDRLAFIISLDGFKQSHDYLRGSGTFDKALNNIKLAIQNGFDVEVNTVVYDKNINELKDFSNFIKDIGASRLNVQVIRPFGVAKEKLKDNLITDKKFLRNIHQDELDWQTLKIDNNTQFCTSCKTGLLVDYNANVYACLFINETPIGNLKNNRLIEIYKQGINNNPLFNIKKSTECYSCELFNNYCAGGCRARALIMNGSIESCDSWIPFLLNHTKFSETDKQPHEFLLI